MFLLLLQMGKTGTGSNKSQGNQNEQKKLQASDGSKRKKTVKRNSQASISFY